MKAAFFNRLTYKTWTGPSRFSGSTFQPFAMSERVPDGENWLVLAASISERFNSAQNVYLGIIPHPGSDTISFGYSPDYSADLIFANSKNLIPLRAGVQWSHSAASGTSGENTTGPDRHSVNPLSFGLGMLGGRKGRKRFVVPSGWALLAFQEPSTGGDTNFFITLQAALIVLCDAEFKQFVVRPTRTELVTY